MLSALLPYCLIALAAAVTTFAAVPFCRVGAKKFGVEATADSYRKEKKSTPLLGGLAMYSGFVIAIGVAFVSGKFTEVFAGTSEPLGVLLAVTIACGVGLLDDVRDISAPAKTAGMAVVGISLVLGGVNIIWFRVPFLDVFVVDNDLSFLVTILWVLGMTNAVNFIDGLDGLAAGVVGIGAIAFLLYGMRLGEVDLLFASNIGPLLAAIIAGVCLGFLPWNFYPAKIFMGDSGSLLLGTLLASSTMAVGGRTADPFSGQTFFFYAPLVIPLVILGVPIADTAFAIIRRASSRQGLATADKDHLHHRLVRLGHGHRRSVLILWAWTGLLSLFVLYPTYNEGKGDAIVPLGVAALGAMLYLGLIFYTLKPRNIDQESLQLEKGIRSKPSPLIIKRDARFKNRKALESDAKERLVHEIDAP